MIRAFVFIWGIAFILVALTGCAEWRSPDPIPVPEPSIADQIRALGSGFILYGGIAAGLGAILTAIFWVGGIGILGPIIGVLSRVPFLSSLAPIIATGGTCAVAIGAIFSWLADNLWLVVLACLVALVAWGYCHRRSISRWVDRLSDKTSSLKSLNH